MDGTLLKTKKKGKKKLATGSARSIELTSSVSTVEVWLNGPRTHLQALQPFAKLVQPLPWLT